MQIAIVQIDTTVGAVTENGAAILRGIERAKAAGAELAVFSELTVPGYPPLDLLERRTFVDGCLAEELKIAERMPDGITAIFGNVRRRPKSRTYGRELENVAVIAERGRELRHVVKSLIPTYDVFDESRYFEPSRRTEPGVVDIRGHKVGITICEDIWNDEELWANGQIWLDKSPTATRLYERDPVTQIAEAGAEIMVNISASPWSSGKESLRTRVVKHLAVRHGMWVVYANLIGGNDGLIFDGGSMVCSPTGTRTARGASFAEDLVLAEVAAGEKPAASEEDPEPIACIHDALVLGIRDYFGKTGLKRAVIGFSGGIDSAVTGYLAAQALGPENVIALGMPSAYSSAGSVADARQLAERLGVRFELIPIQPVFESFLAALLPGFDGLAPDVTEENLQSRIRGVMVMAIANKHGAAALCTGNKSESSMGYCTLYGDTVGAISVLADLYKHQVYALARYANREREIIPEASITKPPSAELRPDQRDEDSLPPYAQLDRMLELFIEDRASAEEISEKVGVPLEVARDVIRKVYLNEFKRKQLPPALRVSQKSWVGRMYPIVQRWTE